MTDSSDMLFPILLLMTFLLIIAAAAIPTLIAISVGIFHFLHRSSRERVEGTHTPAAQGSRYGMKLGAAAAVVLSLPSLPAIISNGHGALLSLDLLALCVLPLAAFGMLSGSMAGQCATRIGAVTVGALMFLLLYDPVMLVLMIHRMFAVRGNVLESLPTDALRGFFTLAHISGGGLVGYAAHHLGHQRAATLEADKRLTSQNNSAPVVQMNAAPAAAWCSMD